MAAPVLAVLGLSGGELILILSAFLILAAIAVVGLIVFLALGLLKRPRANAPSTQVFSPEASAPSGRQVAQHANLAGSQFQDVNLSGAEFDNVNLTGTRFHNVNLSNMVVTAAQMGGAVFKHIGPPPGPAGQQERQRPVRFEEMMLCDSVFLKVDLSHVRVTDCQLDGMTINGLLVTELLAAYERQKNS